MTLTREDISIQVRKILAALQGVPVEAVTEGALMESLARVQVNEMEMITALEGEFGLDILDAEAAKFRTVEDVVNYVTLRSN
jgi:acyl carrier protein